MSTVNPGLTGAQPDPNAVGLTELTKTSSQSKPTAEPANQVASGSLGQPNKRPSLLRLNPEKLLNNINAAQGIDTNPQNRAEITSAEIGAYLETTADGVLPAQHRDLVERLGRAASEHGPLDLETTQQILAQWAGDDNVATATALAGDGVLQEISGGRPFVTVADINSAIDQESTKINREGGSAKRLEALHYLLQAATVSGRLWVDQSTS
jgi:hypothetical protein